MAIVLEPWRKTVKYIARTGNVLVPVPGPRFTAGVFLPQQAFFDPEFFAYLEDVDLNLRARRNGLRCMYIAQAQVYHIGSASSGSKINSLTIRLSTRNNIFVLLKNYPPRIFVQFFPAICIYQLAWMLFCLKKGMILPYCQGVVQGISRLFHFYRKGREFQSGGGLSHPREFAAMIRAAECEAVGSIMARRTAAGKNNFLLACYCKLFFL